MNPLLAQMFTELFTSKFTNDPKKLVLVPDRLFQISLMFESKAGAYPRKHLSVRYSTQGWVPGITKKY
jgi:hypothetical protein